MKCLIAGVLMFYACCLSAAGETSASASGTTATVLNSPLGEAAIRENAYAADFTTTQMPMLQIDSSGTTFPWTHLDFNNSPRNFQFAIVTDRTGGVRPGIFEDAVRKLNLLQPEFVMSVGDLISGYTQQPEEILAQWQEFMGFVKQLKMPFFYVPGNHDLANPVQHALWEQVIGRKYYSFTYGDVLFLCVNSEDPAANIGDEQVAYFDKVLRENPNVRWTLVFLHRPLWVAKERTVHPDQETYAMSGWENMERVLQGRPYTVFAGHFHNYTKEVRHDQRYITLATTGGGTQLRGALNYGEFDHFAWVTMTDSGPIIANLELGGIWDEDVRTSSVARMVNQMVRQGIQARPVVTPPIPFTSATAQLRLTNNADIPLKLWVNFDRYSGLNLTPNGFEKTVQPNSVELVEVSVSGARVRDPLELQNKPLRFRWRSLYEPEGQRKIELSGQREIEVFAPLYCTSRTRPVNINGLVDEWSTLPIAMRKPHQADGRKPWRGVADARVDCAVQSDEEFVYVAADVTDDVVVTSASITEGLPDSIELRIRAATDGSSTTQASAERLNKRQLRRRSRAPRHASKHELLLKTGPALVPHRADKAAAACAEKAGGYTAEFAIPISALHAIGADDEHFQLNLTLTDRDKIEAPAAARLWWQPDWSGPMAIDGAGVFIIKGR
ncbi:MAG: metallophosphoesterase [Candidatus Sumerlaeaceae bacterium]